MYPKQGYINMNHINQNTSRAQELRLAVSPGDAARMAGIGRTKLYELIAANEIASIKFGSRRLIRVSAIEAWLDSLSAEA
jgi:excisionase family DNA binding protein